MKIKRFFAPDMRQAISRVREELGPDAVILSNRRVEGGIEIVAAQEYDDSLVTGIGDSAQEAPAQQQSVEAREAEPLAEETDERSAGLPRNAERPRVEWSQDPVLTSMQSEIKHLRGMLEHQLSNLAWADMARNSPVKGMLMQRLDDIGISHDVARSLVSRIDEISDDEHAWRQMLGLLAHSIDVTNDDILSSGGVVAVVGPTCVGKTATVAKLAARYALRHGKRHVALVTTDNYRIGAHDQLVTFGRILGIPVYIASGQEELSAQLKDLSDKRLVLIDTAGMSQRDMRINEQIQTLHDSSPLIRSYLVLSANTQSQTLAEVVRAFGKVELNGCIITKTDETASMGGVLSAIIREQIPVAYVGDGQRVPEDMHPARAYSLISKAVLLSQNSNPDYGENHIMLDREKTANAHV